MNFLFGFLCCWIIIAVLQLLADTFNWLEKDWYLCLTAAPITFPAIIISIIIHIFVYQWKNVVHPVSKNIFESEIKRINLKVLHIGCFKICYDKKAKLLCRLYFVITRKK